VILYHADGSYVLYPMYQASAGFYWTRCGAVGSTATWSNNSIVIDQASRTGETFVRAQIHTMNGLVEERDIPDFTVL
jgi:hypothetical protein